MAYAGANPALLHIWLSGWGAGPSGETDDLTTSATNDPNLTSAEAGSEGGSGSGTAYLGEAVAETLTNSATNTPNLDVAEVDSGGSTGTGSQTTAEAVAEAVLNQATNEPNLNVSEVGSEGNVGTGALTAAEAEVNVLTNSAWSQKFTPFSDNFNDNSIDPLKWTVLDTSAPVIGQPGIIEQNQQLEVLAGWDYPSVEGIDWWGLDLQVKITEATFVDDDITIYLGFSPDDSHSFGFRANSGSSLWRFFGSGMGAPLELGSAPPLPFWMRLYKHEGEIQYVYSLDGTNWISVGSASDSGFLASRPKLEVGSWSTSSVDALANDQWVAFDDFVLLNPDTYLVESIAETLTNSATNTPNLNVAEAESEGNVGSGTQTSADATAETVFNSATSSQTVDEIIGFYVSDTLDVQGTASFTMSESEVGQEYNTGTNTPNLSVSDVEPPGTSEGSGSQTTAEAIAEFTNTSATASFSFDSADAEDGTQTGSGSFVNLEADAESPLNEALATIEIDEVSISSSAETVTNEAVNTPSLDESVPTDIVIEEPGYAGGDVGVYGGGPLIPINRSRDQISEDLECYGYGEGNLVEYITLDPEKEIVYEDRIVEVPVEVVKKVVEKVYVTREPTGGEFEEVQAGEKLHVIDQRTLQKELDAAEARLHFIQGHNIGFDKAAKLTRAKMRQ